MYYIGISGWTYAGWRKVFYPKTLPQSQELEYASRVFRSIEVNGTFYRLQRPTSYQSWYERTPDDFVFSVKANRYITHIRRLNDVDSALANFFASGVLCLKEKLGPILWQFPPSFVCDHSKMSDFFARLPKSRREACKLADNNELEPENVAYTVGRKNLSIRHCVEIRHKSFMTPDFFSLLKDFGIAFVIADAARKWPYAEELTADFVYIRLHGDEELYTSGYTPTAIKEWARKIRLWSKGRPTKDVYVYFDNDRKVKAPRDAKRLQELLEK